MTAVCRKTHEHGATPFGDRLKKMRVQRDIGLVEFARLVGIHYSAVARMENQGVKPGWDTAVAIAQVLECSLDYLAGMEPQGMNVRDDEVTA